MSGPGAFERLRQTGRLLRSEGSAAVTARALTRAARRLAPAGYGSLPVERTDLLRAAELAESGWVLPDPLPARPGEPLTIAWVCLPPAEGSGGHTSMFRMATALARAGHRCVVYLQDQHGWSLSAHERRIRHWWPWLDAELRSLADGIEDAHAIFATSWMTAYPVLASPARGVRLYLVQDFEPWFYPAGSEALLAEATYRFGFHGVALGPWLSELLRREYGMTADHFEFGCDLDLYGAGGPQDGGERAGVCYYCRPSTPRRAHELAVVALDLFADAHPEVELHLFGQAGGRLPFRATEHGLLKPAQLAALYRRCVAGLSLSATNVSLVPLEMLAAGCIPVINDAEHNRVVLDNPEIAYAGATPFELAAALGRLVDRPAAERAAAAEAAAASVKGMSWEGAGAKLEAVVRRVVEERSADRIAA